ncbi:MAG: NADH-quinone oxidoreductase subunit N [bacterium]|nr:NADH-quinone oxidoreductase subunit N [bacterium]
MIDWSKFDWVLLSPELIIFAAAILVIVIDLILPKGKGISGWLTIIGLLASLSSTFTLRQGEIFGGMLVLDNLAIFSKQLLLAITILVTLSSVDYIKKLPANRGEYYGLLLLATLGLLFMVSAAEFITLFISLELASLSCIILAGYLKKDPKSAEAGVKYLLFGVLSSAILLYGLSFLYGLTGSTFLKDICPETMSPIVLLTIILLMAGFGFKIAAVPFHMWVPDTYEGAPTPITTYLATASKVAGFVVILRVFLVCFVDIKVDWLMLMAVLSVLSMGLGNLCAIPQTNIKRMLAYSSVAHAGYILIGLAVVTDIGIGAVILYLLVYSLASLGAFLVVIAFSNQTGSDTIEDYAGLWKRAPLLSLAMLLSLVSMAGIPPLAGFIGKFYLFAGAIKEGLIWLPVAGVLFSVVSVYYYFMVVKTMYFKEPKESTPIITGKPLSIGILIAVMSIIVIGIYPAPFLNLAILAIKSFFGC